MFRAAEQGREAGSRIEPRPAQPVDRSVAADERGGFAIADQSVVLNERTHRSTCPPNSNRMADSILAANSSSPREVNRWFSAAVSTGAGVP